MKTKIDALEINYEEFGAGPAILVLHDGPSNREIAELFLPLAETGYRVIVTHLDGLMNRKTPSLDFPACSRTAVALLKYLGVGRAVTFGIGLGATVLLEMLASSPGRVAAASLVFGPLAAKEIELADRPALSTALQDRRFRGLLEELPAAAPAAAREQAALSSLSALRAWINRVRSRNVYASTISHRPPLLAETEIPRLLLESEQRAGAGKTGGHNVSREI